MDELWQRYRNFWTPVLIGLGVFLVGLIAVHVMSDDPQLQSRAADGQGNELRRKVEPTRQQLKNVPQNADKLEGRVADWAMRLDQAAGEDPVEYAVAASLRSAILRGADPAALGRAVANPSGAGAADVLLPFGGDAVAAGRALTRYEAIRQDRLGLLRAGDPNVGFSRLLSDVWNELRVRANRADVDLGVEMMGFGSITSVTRAALPQRLLNLALISDIMDLGIRSGIRSVDEVRFELRADVEGGDVFLREWPVTMKLQGDMDALRPILARLTDPKRPVPVELLVLTQPPRGSPLEGLVQLSFIAQSTIIRADASLELEKEDA